MNPAPSPGPLSVGLFGVACLGVGLLLGHLQAARTNRDASRLLAAGATPAAPLAFPPSPSSAAHADAAEPSPWQAIRLLPPTPESEAQACSHLETLANRDPAAALRLALDAATPRQRELLRNAALRGWAASDPLAAADWTLANVRYEERRVAVEALAAGAVARPDAAILAIGRLVSSDPVLACDHGNALVVALARTGHYIEAGRFATSGPSEHRAAWLGAAFQQWGTYQPRAALLALDQIADPATRQQARSGLYAGWGADDPAALVAHARSLPAGDARIEALNQGLSQWVNRDPAAASAWMEDRDPSPDLDAGVAAIALSSVLVTQKPDVAAGWAESIMDPELRANTLLDLIRAWAEHDVDGARAYAVQSPALPPETRAVALATLQPAP